MITTARTADTTNRFCKERRIRRLERRNRRFRSHYSGARTNGLALC